MSLNIGAIEFCYWSSIKTSANSEGEWTQWRADTEREEGSVQLQIVIVNSRFLERPQKRSRGNQLIHRRLTKTKLIGSGQDPGSQADRQSDGYGGWCLEFRRGGRYDEDDKSG